MRDLYEKHPEWDGKKIVNVIACRLPFLSLCPFGWEEAYRTYSQEEGASFIGRECRKGFVSKGSFNSDISYFDSSEFKERNFSCPVGFSLVTQWEADTKTGIIQCIAKSEGFPCGLSLPFDAVYVDEPIKGHTVGIDFCCGYIE